MKRLVPLVVVGLGLLVVAVLIARRPTSPVGSEFLSDPSSEAETAEALGRPRDRVSPREIPHSAVDRGPKETKDKRPPSLRKTDVDGALVVDENGKFQATNDALEMFDYFFTASGERSDEEIIAMIVAEIHKTLDPAAAAQALDFLNTYLEYRKLGGQLGQESIEGESLLTRFDRLKALRRQLFGEVLAEQLFGAEERLTQLRLEQQLIADDETLPEQERKQRIEELNQELLKSLPEEQLAARERSQAPMQLLRDEAALREQGGSPEDIHTMRVERFGEEAATRLAELDLKRRQWQDRLDTYHDHRRRIEEDPKLSSGDRAQALEQLSQESFSANERVRVEALERIANGQ